MDDIKDLSKEIEKIKARNRRVETDKAWETSWSRRIVVFILTYFVIVVFFIVANLPDPFISSIVPALAFVLSTSTLPFLKKFWLKYVYKSEK
ncbi:hypothetical protein M1271_06710 [Patescibacteria group bacterium]|nr:hypothetical protein [Patescibacteria group bacterium]